MIWIISQFNSIYVAENHLIGFTSFLKWWCCPHIKHTQKNRIEQNELLTETLNYSRNKTNVASNNYKCQLLSSTLLAVAYDRAL